MKSRTPLLAGGAAVPLLTAAGLPVLVRRQASGARAQISALTAGLTWPAAAALDVPAPPGAPDDDPSARTFRLVVAGDSGGVGLGADSADDTVGVLLAHRLAAALRRPVRLRVVAVSGADATDLERQVALTEPGGEAHDGLGGAPDLVVVNIGANDVTHRLRPGTAARLLGEAVGRWRQRGARVVVGTCPDLGTVAALGHPLRWWAAAASRLEWRAQQRAVAAAGGAAVPLGALLGPVFAAEPDHFSADGFHPSSRGYRALADALWPAVTALTGAEHGVSG